jgi:hypothetical protein
LISNIIPTLYQKLNINLAKRLDPEPHSPSTTDEILDKPDKGTNKFLQIRMTSSDQDDGSIPLTTSKLGYLIPLSCGHNVPYKIQELALYEYHLRMAKMIQ